MLNIKVNMKPLQKEIKKWKRDINKVQSAANTQLARDAGSAVKKNLRSKYNIPASELTAKRGGRVQLWRANAKDLAAKLITKKWRGVKLVKYKGLPRVPQGHKPIKQRTPTKATVRKGRTKILEHAFIAIMRSGHRGIFVRRKDNSRTIKELYGPSAHDLYQLPSTLVFIKQFVKNNYQRIYKSTYDRLNKRRK